MAYCSDDRARPAALVRRATSKCERQFSRGPGGDVGDLREHVVGPMADHGWFRRAGRRPCGDDIVPLFSEFAGIGKREKNCRHGNCAQTPKRRPFRAAGVAIIAR